MDWDLSPYFESVESDDFKSFFASLERSVGDLRGELANLAPLSANTVAAWRLALTRYEDVATRQAHLMSFLYCMRAYDVADAGVQQAAARAGSLDAAVSALLAELRRGVGTAPPELVTRLLEGELGALAFFVERLRREAAFSMDPTREALAADLGTDGIAAWGRLYTTLAGKLELDLEHADGTKERVPMAQRRALLRDADRDLRRAAFEAGNEAWRSVSDTAAAALNHIAGTRLTLYRHRGVAHFLDVALDQACISRKTLDAMLEAVDGHADIPRRFLRLKAKALGLQRLALYDLEAPIERGTEEPLSWERGKQMVQESFGASYPALARFFEQAVERRWVEHSPRPGKAPGAFCTSSPLLREARVFMTYQGSLGDVSTLAHEIGHAFHSHVLRDERPLARRYPMTLAESASTFAELLLSDGLRRRSDVGASERLTLLGEALGDSAVFLLDITTRFRFESAVYERRASGELSVAELEELMVSTQREVFGDVLEAGGEDPLFWASKLHFFITGVSFYNFPYTFGYLLSRGLRAMHQAEGDAFLPRYERFLAASGQGWAHEVARSTLGRDLESPEFWEDSILSLVPDLDRFDELVRAGVNAGTLGA